MFSIWHSWKFAHFGVKQQSLTHSHPGCIGSFFVFNFNILYPVRNTNDMYIIILYLVRNTNDIYISILYPVRNTNDMQLLYCIPRVTRTTCILFDLSYLGVVHSCRRIIQKRIVRTKLNIYVFMFTCDVLIFCLDTTCTTELCPIVVEDYPS